jgi:hypothetical protein
MLIKIVFSHARGKTENFCKCEKIFCGTLFNIFSNAWKVM